MCVWCGMVGFSPNGSPYSRVWVVGLYYFLLEPWENIGTLGSLAVGGHWNPGLQASWQDCWDTKGKVPKCKIYTHIYTNNECWHQQWMLLQTIWNIHVYFQVFLLNVVLAIFQQWLVPTALNSLEPFREMDYTRMLERLLLLAVCIVSHDCHVMYTWLSCDHSYPTTSSGCCFSTSSSTLWWTQLEKYCGLQTESFTVTGGKICALI